MTLVARLGTQNDAKIFKKKVVPGRFFRKRGNMRSARASAVQALFLTCNFEPVSATMQTRRPSESGVQNTYAKYLHFVHFGVVLSAQGAPKGFPERPFCYIFNTFCMTWPDDPSRLVQTSSFRRHHFLQVWSVSGRYHAMNWQHVCQCIKN